MNEKQKKEYIRSQSMASGPVTIDDLVCKDCVFVGKDMPTAFCYMFKKGQSRKPNVVLLGGGCPEFVRRKGNQDNGEDSRSTGNQ